MNEIVVRGYEDRDWPQVWPIIEQVVRAGDTFPYPTDLSEQDARGLWLDNGPRGRAAVVVDGDVVLGTAKMGPNRPGPGSHVATASYMVKDGVRGRGVGRALVVDSLTWARESGFAAMQFNAVVEENVERCGSTSISASPSSGPCPPRTSSPTAVAWASTSCTSRSERRVSGGWSR